MDEGLQPLLDAVLAIGADLDLERTLDRVVSSARRLVGARYGALGVLGPGGTGLSTFLHDGIDDDTARAIGPLPTGHGVLGQLIRDPRPLLLDELAEHPASSPLPPGHPPMTSFLGVPVRVGDEVFGNLYLTDKAGGFHDDDRQLAVALAAVAGAAIRNARAADRLALDERLQRSAAELATAVLGGADVEELRELVVTAASALTGSATADLAPAPAGAVAGSVVTEDGDRILVLGGDHPAVRVRPRLDRVAIGADDDAALAVLAGQAGVALAYAAARADSERLLLETERGRIARDLHDTVIQRIFGAGLRLDALGRRLDDEAAPVVEDVLAELDRAIADLRSTIAALDDPLAAPLDEALRAVMAALRPVAPGLRRLVVHGDVGEVSDEVAAELRAVLREAITNAARHAPGHAVEVTLTIDDERVLLVVHDEAPPASPAVGSGGREGPSSGGGLGLANLRARATRHGGSCELLRHPRGATLRWWVPLGA